MSYRTVKSQIKVKDNKANNYTDFFYKVFRNILIVSIPLLLISALILSLPHSSATTSSSDSLSISILPACTLDSVVESSHTATVNAGTHTSDIGSTRINAYCNDNNGYSIYAIGSSNNVDGNTDLVNSNISSNYNIHTGIYDENNSSSLTTSSWSMKLTAGNGSGIDTNTGSSIPLTPPTIMNGYNNYNVIPSNYTLVASRTSGTNMTIDTDVTGSYFTTTYDVYASSVQPAGSYEGKVKYVMVHPNSNDSNTIPDINAAFAAAGKQPAYQDADGYYYAMQDMDPTICASVNRKGEVTATKLVDTRDQNLYWVTKLDDNKCWMTQNLDLKLNDPNTASLTSENTDISDDPTVYTSTPYATGYTVNNGVYTWTPSNTTANAIVDYVENKATGWGNSSTTPRSAEGGDTYIYTNNVTGNTLDGIYDSLQACIEADHNAEDCRHYHVGNYYNQPAAVASNNSSGFSTQYNNATNSICPKGWRLPIATDANNESREFGDLLVGQGIMNSTTATSYETNGFINIRKAPLWFVRSGYIIDRGTLYDAASYGNYWSSTVVNAYSTYYLEFNSDNVKPATYNASHGTNNGRSIRCLARSAGE